MTSVFAVTGRVRSMSVLAVLSRLAVPACAMRTGLTDMANVFRRLLAVLLLMVSASSFAGWTVSTGTNFWTSIDYSARTPTYYTMDAVCGRELVVHADSTYNRSVTSTTSDGCNINVTKKSDGSYVTTSFWGISNGYIFTGASTACPSGWYTDGTICQQQAPAPATCAGDVSAVAAATRIHWIVAPITCDALDANGNALCHGTNPQTGKPDSQNIACNGGQAGPASGPVPAPVPVPPPQTNVDFPKCPSGSYEYVDTDGSSACSLNGITISNTTSCGSLNYGSVNGTMVCLPPNPAPATAAAAAAAAAAKADTAKANPATPAAQAAAAGAAADAQKATDAANSLPTDAPTQSSAASAVAAAKQAAGYAGVGYAGPGGPGNGTLPDSGAKECGTPGHPKCQIDETGTPTGAGAFDAASSAMGTAMQGATDGLATVTSATGKDTSWGWMPLSWVAPGQCQPLSLGTMPVINVVIAFDMCPALRMASELLTFLWVVGTIGVILSMVWDTIQGG